MVKNVAVILTVFNRKEITLSSLNGLYKAIAELGVGYVFDIYMTDDGSSDGTRELVFSRFPNINIIRGNGQLYWGGGMRAAWMEAVNSGIIYDYFLWFNDDVELYNDALVTLLGGIKDVGEHCLISGAFCGRDGKASYGGRDQNNIILAADGSYQEITLMNGNLVLVPKCVYEELGFIDMCFPHGLGDWDYGLRAIKKRIKIYLTPKNVGVTERHDIDYSLMWSCQISLFSRLKRLYSVKFSPNIFFVFNRRHYGLFIALKEYVKTILFAIFPFIFELKKK